MIQKVQNQNLRYLLQGWTYCYIAHVSLFMTKVSTIIQSVQHVYILS